MKHSDYSSDRHASMGQYDRANRDVSLRPSPLVIDSRSAELAVASPKVQI